MYKSLVHVARQICDIARKREKRDRHGIVSFREVIDTPHSPYEDQLFEILNTLDLEEVMAIQTIMYLGRDRDFNSSLTADEVFLNYNNYIKSLGVKDKDLEISQIVQKMPLAKYLTEGYKILGIEL